MRNYLLLAALLLSQIKIFAQNNTNCLDFDGSNDYVELGSLPAMNQFTIEFWIKIPTSQPGTEHGQYEMNWWQHRGIIDNTETLSSLSNSDWGISLKESKFIMFGIGGSSGDYSMPSITAINDNNWHHVAVTWENINKRLEIFLDGVLNNYGTTISTGLRSFSNMLLGANKLFNIYYSQTGSATTNNPYFNGKIDELRIWSVVRTASEISNNKDKQINGSATGLLASYHFNQGTANGSNPTETTLTYDAGASGYNGTLFNFALSGATSNWVSAGLTLPVTWQSFTATKKPTTVELDWSTASEQNTKEFEVQYSTNTQDWSLLGTIAAAGNSSTKKDYNFTHNSPLKGSIYNYYRIKQNDLDGKYSYSKIVSIIYNEPGNDVMLYPNPVRDVITIFLAESQQLRLLNMAGATVWQGRLAAGRNQLSVSHLPKGVYVLQTSKGPQQIIIQ